MANVATERRFTPYECTNTGTIAIALDQVDDGTNDSLIYKPFCTINRMNDKYHREDERLKTFQNWPLDFLDKAQLAQTGMFFTNEEDKVKCYFCEVEIGRWEREDQPVPEHLRWSPNCPLLRRRTTNNVPLNIEALDRILPPVSFDICGGNDATEVHPHAYSEGRIPLSHIRQSTGVNTTIVGNGALATSTATATQANGIERGEHNEHDVYERRQPSSGSSYFPEYPDYIIETARLRSFAEWPRNMKQKPQQLAEAGFFYTGVGDRVRCFSCGGGLKDWDDNDEPWEQHALWLSQCHFLKLMKGQLFIDTVAAVAHANKSTDDEAEKDKSQTPETSTTATTTTDIPPAMALTTTHISAELSTDIPPPPPSASSGDNMGMASTAATRIYEKIVANGQKSNSPAAPACQTIPEEKLCKICYASEYNTAFLPCGHVVACAKCASSVTKCPLCRKPFTDVMRVYFS